MTSEIHFTIPRRGPRLTVFAASCGLLALLWLGGEDTGTQAAAGMGWLLASLGVALQITGRWGGRNAQTAWLIRGSILAGGLIGLLSAPTTALLMLIKTAAHGHPTPDYLATDILAVLSRLPAWTAAGLLLGPGIALVGLALTIIRRNR